MHPSNDMEFEMSLCPEEQEILHSCKYRIHFVNSLFTQSQTFNVELNEKEMAGLALILCDVLNELDAIEDGKYCQPQTAEAVSEERTLAVSEAAHQNEQAEARGMQ